MTESPVDVAAIKAQHQSDDPEMDYSECMECCHEWPCLTSRLADALDRAQAASEGVDLLIAQAERRGAVKAFTSRAQKERDPVRAAWLVGQADGIENGADL